MINNNINYKDLAEYVRLAMEEFEFHNNTEIEGYSFSDLIAWLEHFEDLNTNARKTIKTGDTVQVQGLNSGYDGVIGTILEYDNIHKLWIIQVNNLRLGVKEENLKLLEWSVII